MLRKTFFLALATTLVTLLTSSEARAWGAAHVGYTHVGYGGIQHYGATAVRAPYGGYSAGYRGGYSSAGYRGGYGYTDRYGGAAYGGYHYSYSGYNTAVRPAYYYP